MCERRASSRPTTGDGDPDAVPRTRSRTVCGRDRPERAGSHWCAQPYGDGHASIAERRHNRTQIQCSRQDRTLNEHARQNIAYVCCPVAALYCRWSRAHSVRSGPAPADGISMPNHVIDGKTSMIIFTACADPRADQHRSRRGPSDQRRKTKTDPGSSPATSSSTSRTGTSNATPRISRLSSIS